MIARVVKRLAWTVCVLWAVCSLVFVVNNVVPGDAARMLSGPQASEADVARLRATLGLDRPVGVQYAIFFRRLVHTGPAESDPSYAREHATCAVVAPHVHVDLGRSITHRRPVATVIAERFPRTLSLALVAMAVQLALGVSAGTLAARRRGRTADRLALLLTLVGISVPTFVTGLFLQYVLAHRYNFLPLDGFGTTFAEHVACVVMPGVTLGIFGAAYYTRLVRDEVLVQLSQDYVRTARAKGVSELGVTRHALRNAALPLTTVVGLELGALIGGAVVTEQIFRWPGIGSLSVQALLDRDGPLIMGTVLVTSIAIVVANLLVDAVTTALDPRLRR